jgi:hydroxymethylglutaryl-CoA lyase
VAIAPATTVVLVPQLPHQVTIVEVGPRDGLQVADRVLTVDQRIELIMSLAAAGTKRLEAVSFVRADAVPQMAGAEEVIAGLPHDGGVSYIGLVLNERGLDRALATSVDEVNFVVAAADGYSIANSRMPSHEVMAQVERMAPVARQAGKRTSVTLSVAFGDPYDGEVAPERLVELADRSVQAGIDEVALADTIGAAVPKAVVSLIGQVRPMLGDAALRLHFHDTRRTAMANVWAALEIGVADFDASVGGLGGSPFAPGAGGNVATEDLLYLLERSGVDAAQDLDAVLAVARTLGTLLGQDLPGALTKSGPFPPR